MSSCFLLANPALNRTAASEPIPGSDGWLGRNMECPECHSREGVTKLRQPFDFSLGFLLLAFLGGAIGGVFWGLGQENKYRCERCQRIFFSHTRLTRVFWIMAIVTYVSIGSVLLYAFVLSPKR